MARHKMPQKTKRRLIAAATAAVAIIGTGVYIGVTGSASARDAGVADQQCLPDVTGPGASSSQAPPNSSQPAPPAESGSETAPPPESSSEPAPPEETPPADQPPAETPAPPTETQPATYNHQHHQGTHPAAAQPPADGSAAAAPDEKGAEPPTTPAPQPQAQEIQRFPLPSCTDQFGPFPQDFVNIFKVRPTNVDPRPGRNASRGSFTSRCGTNQNHHNNPDNFIVAPGVQNGAHHLHDYVGNLSADGSSTNESLAAAGTTCANGDKSTYYWPVIRLRSKDGNDKASEAENPHNIGTVVQPVSVSLRFRGNAQSKVVAMPDFMRVITGDAKAAINGGANGNAKWTCTGFTNRFTTKYPICPRGSQLQRVLDFASCWDGKNFDSANHRTHVVFPDKTGACPAGTKAVPQLRMTLTYNLPRRTLFALDAFPEVAHNPITDHGDFVNVMPKQVMDRAVQCINSGRNC